MISAKFFVGENVLLGGKQQIDAKKIQFSNFWDRPLNEIIEYAFKF